jgi:tetratricopeptide (TPR) repeat protein
MPLVRQFGALHALAAAALATSLCAGCRTFGKQPVAENVVEARQMSRRGLDALERGNHAEAEKAFADAIARCPVDERARCHYAELLWQRGERGAAVKQLEEAVRLSGGDAALHVRLGQMQFQRGDAAAAQACAARAVAADRRLAEAWALLGDTQRAAHETEAALATYHRALALRDFYPAVQLAVADIYRTQRKPQRALATLAALEDRYPAGQAPPDLFAAQGQALQDLGRFGDAALAFRTAIERGGPSAELHYAVAEALLHSGDSANARLAILTALEHAPGHAPSLRMLEALNAPPAETARY